MTVQITITQELFEALQARAEELRQQRQFEHSPEMVANELLANALLGTKKSSDAESSARQDCPEPQPQPLADFRMPPPNKDSGVTWPEFKPPITR